LGNHPRHFWLAVRDLLCAVPVIEPVSWVIDLLLFLVVALVSSNLASRLRCETERLREREREIQQLYEFSRRLAACFTVSDLISAIQNHLSRTLGQQAAFFGRWSL
jgi:two-component system sensor histidine kinase KdpD